MFYVRKQFVKLFVNNRWKSSQVKGEIFILLLLACKIYPHETGPHLQKQLLFHREPARSLVIQQRMTTTNGTVSWCMKHWNTLSVLTWRKIRNLHCKLFFCCFLMKLAYITISSPKWHYALNTFCWLVLWKVNTRN